MTKSNNKNQYIRAVGRRKSAICNIKLFSGKSDSTINGLTENKYFPGSVSQIAYEKPFKTTDTLGKFHFQAKIIGGGQAGQLEALVLAISRALKLTDANFTAPLAAAGLLTVDSRVRERRMVGTGGKARRQKQSPKR